VAGASQSSSEDDDVPLGILQAHNFPNSKKPVDPRFSANSFVGARPMSSSSRPASPSTRPGSKQQRSSALPPFAPRVQMQDIPYLGADLVNAQNRESLQFNQPRAQSTFGGATRPAQQHRSNIPSNGLIGVIIDEERSKAARRGSPNGPGGMGYLPPQAQHQNTMNQQQMGGYGMPYNQPMPMATPGGTDQQLFLMDQILKMQQQIQQMQMQNNMSSGASMMGVAPMGGAPSMMGGMAPMMNNGIQHPQNRPMSVAANGGSRPTLQQARTMSMMSRLTLDPYASNGRTMSMANFSSQGFNMQNPNYAPSVAPSERSVIGQPSRYKPVATNSADGGSTITAGSTFAPTIKAGEKKNSGRFLSAVMHSGKKAGGHVSPETEENDDEDWGAMARKRLARNG